MIHFKALKVYLFLSLPIIIGVKEFRFTTAARTNNQNRDIFGGCTRYRKETVQYTVTSEREICTKVLTTYRFILNIMKLWDEEEWIESKSTIQKQIEQHTEPDHTYRTLFIMSMS